MLNALLIEDELDLAVTIIDYLALEDIQCDHAANGLAGLHLIRCNQYHAIILDLGLPKMDGLRVCESLRKDGISTPILMLTARDSLNEKLAGFKAGTDDYLIKPFAMEELVVRIKVLSNRKSGQVNILHIAGLCLDVGKKQVLRNNNPISLSPICFKLLEVLMRSSPEAISREEIISRVWGDNQPDSNSLKVHLYNLRKAINVGAQENLIHTVTGFGFIFKGNS